ncbi:mechanosensitive ion channel family protein [Cerasicoccus arenae]|uniref:Transporter n=1 Tax=Cerasicoccus arenae TaxID=424488 RepID=A0A8J3GCY3_9BACT|nr:mechanosensitive ion channel family protein [Cerasicoccus arenae]MBK1858010.1 mechanosensitive ion channel family protein [Cerasicoccus arenae]GHB97487.1 transporter [Cerasicoccus arenae]
MNMELLDEELWGNTIWRYILALLCVLSGYLIAKFLEIGVRAMAKRQDQDGKDTAAKVFYEAVGRSFGAIGMSIGFRFATGIIEFPGRIETIADTAAAILIVLAFGLMVLHLVAVPEYVLRKKSQQDDARMDAMLAPLIGRTIRVVVIAVIVLQIFQIVSGKDITTILAGLGIASLAFGLAAQESIGNIFGAVFLFMNKPFEIGERCNIDGHDGVITEMGLTCTRLQRLDGHMVTIPNGQLYKKTIHNVGKRPYIRRLMNVTITYDTPPEKIEEAVKILRDLLAYKEGDESTKINEPINQGDLLPRVYFNEFNADSLNIICIYWYQPPVYWDFMEHSQWLNLRIIKAFGDADIDFAFPSQTIYLAGDDRRPLTLPGLDSLSKQGGDKET